MALKARGSHPEATPFAHNLITVSSLKVIDKHLAATRAISDWMLFKK